MKDFRIVFNLTLVFIMAWVKHLDGIYLFDFIKKVKFGGLLPFKYTQKQLNYKILKPIPSFRYSLTQMLASKMYTTLNENMIERETEVKLLILAVLCREHVLLLGPPGTGKSELGRRLANLAKEKKSQKAFFESQLTKYTNPEELFGPLSLSSLEQDKYVRNTQGYLPTASIAFLDEIFKANSAILNSLLTILNERKFDNGNERLDVPLMAVVGASNELPDSEELDALYDRFLFRKWVSPISDDGVEHLIKLTSAHRKYYDSSQSGKFDFVICDSDIDIIHTLAAQVDVPDHICELIKTMKPKLKEKSIYISDRRLLKAMKVLRILAVTQGRNEVNILDCMILPYIFCCNPKDESIIYECIRDSIMLNFSTIKNLNDDILMIVVYKLDFNNCIADEIYQKWIKFKPELIKCQNKFVDTIYTIDKILLELRIYDNDIQKKNGDNFNNIFNINIKGNNMPQLLYNQMLIEYEDIKKDIERIIKNIDLCHVLTIYTYHELGGDVLRLYDEHDDIFI